MINQDFGISQDSLVNLENPEILSHNARNVALAPEHISFSRIRKDPRRA
jgi:hypothetical protein